MSKKRGLSLEEKHEKILQIFYDSQDFFLDEMAQFADNDPAAFEAMTKAIEVAHAAANRWTDNIFTLRQWCSNNFPQAKEQLEHLYMEVGVTDDFDYIELAQIPLRSTGNHILEGIP